MDLYSRIFVALGFPHNRYDGEYVWLGASPSQQLFAAVESMPESETEFIAVDLTSSPTELQAYQCARIRELRSEAYRTEADCLFFGAEADGDSRESWMNKRTEIKARYPWAGAYR